MSGCANCRLLRTPLVSEDRSIGAEKNTIYDTSDPGRKTVRTKSKYEKKKKLMIKSSCVCCTRHACSSNDLFRVICRPVTSSVLSKSRWDNGFIGKCHRKHLSFYRSPWQLSRPVYLHNIQRVAQYFFSDINKCFSPRGCFAIGHRSLYFELFELVAHRCGGLYRIVRTWRRVKRGSCIIKTRKTQEEATTVRPSTSGFKGRAIIAWNYLCIWNNYLSVNALISCVLYC